MYRIHNSLNGGYLGLTQTLEEFKKRTARSNYEKLFVD